MNIPQLNRSEIHTTAILDRCSTGRQEDDESIGYQACGQHDYIGVAVLGSEAQQHWSQWDAMQGEIEIEGDVPAEEF